MTGNLNSAVVAPRALRATATPAMRAGAVAELLWLLLLILPAAVALPATLSWSRADVALAVGPLWLCIAARLLFPGRGFFVATLPLVALGVLHAGASALRGVDLLDLALQWRTYSTSEFEAALGPFVPMLAGVAVLLLAIGALAWRLGPQRQLRTGTRRKVAAATLVAALFVPSSDWIRIWPVQPVIVAAAALPESPWLARRLFPQASIDNPRDPLATWNASRVAGAPVAETVVLVIGEAVRSDYLAECGGPSHVRRLGSGALVACDMTSGADSTAMSVPLLVSRELPGHAQRVSSDPTFLHALKESGFETHWYDVQNHQIAYPDADHQDFAAHIGRDSALLMPRLAAALARPAALKGIVLHANNAHDPYCDRFDPASAPYAVDCARVASTWDQESLREKRLAYADAVDASVAFLNEVIAELDRRSEPVFLAYSPDHGEGLMDDSRGIALHALREATSWDTHVPAVFWANRAWRDAHPRQWAHLASQANQPLMHVDLVPTLLDAAGVRYDEPRGLAVDLLARDVPARQRFVQAAPGRTIPWKALVDATRAAGPLPPDWRVPPATSP
jgi:glucan phosphoethanolaminetransferase (alkaline phosphatase superfamily)